MHRRTLQRLSFAGLTLALALVAITQQGCYRRVTNVRGLGGSNYEVSEPYQQNSKIDDWVFGEQRDPNNKVKPYTPHD